MIISVVVDWILTPSLPSEKAQKCPMGRYSDTGLTPCNACPVGQYQPETGKTSCVKCPSGQTTDTTGATSQTQCHDQPDPCAAGTFSLSGQQPCVPCGAGTYQDGTGQKQCKVCKANTYQVRGPPEKLQDSSSCVLALFLRLANHFQNYSLPLC